MVFQSIIFEICVILLSLIIIIRQTVAPHIVIFFQLNILENVN